MNNIQAWDPNNKAYFTEISRDVITDISHFIGHISDPLIVGFLLNSNYLVFHEILSFHRGLNPAKFFFYTSIMAASNLSNKYFCYNLIELPTKIQYLLALQLSSLHSIIRFICQISAVFVKSISIVHHGYAVTAQVIRPPALFLFPQFANEMCRMCLICQLNKQIVGKTQWNHIETSWGFIKEMKIHQGLGLSLSYFTLIIVIQMWIQNWCAGDWVPHRFLLHVQAGSPGDLGCAALECGAAGLARPSCPDHAHQGEQGDLGWQCQCQTQIWYIGTCTFI